MLYNRSESSPYWSGHETDSSVRLPSLPCRHPVVEKMMSGAILDFLVASYRKRAQFAFFCGDEPDHLGGYDGQLEVVGRCLEWFVFDCEIREAVWSISVVAQEQQTKTIGDGITYD